MRRALVLIAVLAAPGAAQLPESLLEVPGLSGFPEPAAVPMAPGAATGQPPAAERLGADLYFPPPKPAIIGREEWIRAEANCERLEESEVNDADIEIDPEPRVRIAIHHSATVVTPAEMKLDEARAKERVKQLLCGIRKYHMGIVKTRVVGKGARRREVKVKVGGHDWSDIGYHYAVDWRGNVWEGRRLEKVGAHVKRNNTGSIGIVLLGNFENQKPAADQLRALKVLLAYLVESQKIDPNGIQGHGDLAGEGRETQCPGRHLSRRGESRGRFDARRASPLRRIREELKPVWQRVPHAQSDEILLADAASPAAS